MEDISPLQGQLASPEPSLVLAGLATGQRDDEEEAEAVAESALLLVGTLPWPPPNSTPKPAHSSCVSRWPAPRGCLRGFSPHWQGRLGRMDRAQRSGPYGARWRLQRDGAREERWPGCLRLLLGTTPASRVYACY